LNSEKRFGSISNKSLVVMKSSLIVAILIGLVVFIASVSKIFAVPPTPTETCGNQIDDDLDGLTDCADFDCDGISPCYIRPCRSPDDLCTWNKGMPLGSENCCGCQLGYNTYWPLNTDNSATCTFDGTGLQNTILYVSVNNDVIRCTLNGNLVFENYEHEGCAPADPRSTSGYSIPISPQSGTNTLVCDVRDDVEDPGPNNMAHFDACVIGERVQCTSNDDCNYLDDECADGICNAQNQCEQQLKLVQTECRASVGDCDLPEFCTGSNVDCPIDTKSNAMCRNVAGDCDTAEYCDGQNDYCPADSFLPDTTECRASAGVCDLAEKCTGSSATCPADAKSTAQCRVSASDCDVTENCDGVNNNCPADQFQPTTTDCGICASCDGLGNCNVYDDTQDKDCLPTPCPDSCNQIPDNYQYTWDQIDDQPNECSAIYTCTQNTCPYVSTCDVTQCNAGCDQSHPCLPFINPDNNCLYDGSCIESCLCSYSQQEYCSPAGTVKDGICYYDCPEPACTENGCQCKEASMDCNDICDPVSGPIDKTGPVTSNVVVDPSNNNGIFDASATATDTCSNIKKSEYFLGHATIGYCGYVGTGTPMDPTDGNFDELIEDVKKDNVQYLVDGLNWICIQSQDTANNWGNCQCSYFDTDILPPDCPYDIYLDSQLYPNEYLICENNAWINATVCDEQSSIQGGEYFLDTTIPPVPAPWSGYWMNVLYSFIRPSDGHNCAVIGALVDTSQLSDGTHYIKLRGKDSVENWGKIIECQNVSFIRDTKPPITTKTLTPYQGEIEQCYDNEQQVLPQGVQLTDGCNYVKGGTQIVLHARDQDTPDHEFADKVRIHWIVWYKINPGDSWTIDQQGIGNEEQDVTITLDKDSYHLIEYWSVDSCGWEETHHYELDIVDNKAPVTTKTIGEPKISVSAGEWYITQQTPITLSCSDQNPHPVDHVTLYWRYNVDGGTPTQWFEEDDGYTQFTFQEDSVHVLEWYCVDSLGNSEPIYSETDRVDSTPPETTKTYGTPLVETNGGYPKWITSQTPITLTPVDGGDICAVGINKTYWRNTLVDDRYCQDQQLCQETNPSVEEKVVINEVEYDDIGADGPGVFIELFGSSGMSLDGYRLIGVNGDVHPHNDYVTIDLSGHNIDANGFFLIVHPMANPALMAMADMITPSANLQNGPQDAVRLEHFNGDQYVVVDILSYGADAPDVEGMPALNVMPGHSLSRNEMHTDTNNNAADFADLSTPTPKSGNPFWNEYTGPFYKPEQSCHLIEYYSVDYLGNTETVKKQCVYVENTPPEIVKTIDTPKHECTVEEKAQYGDSDYGCWYITQNTKITLDCNDVMPHPVDNVVLYYRDYLLGQTAPSYTTVPGGYVDIYKTEDSEHVLEFYCVDALGNSQGTAENLHKEIDIVDTQSPVSQKTLGDPKHACIEAEAMQYYQTGIPSDGCYFITQNTPITLTCTDGQPHPVDHVKIYYRDYLIDQVPPSFTEVADDHITITKTEDSAHILEWYCVDELGNTESTHVEYDIVDTKKPNIVKTIVGPQHGDCPPQSMEDDCFIDGVTKIHVESTDLDPHPVDHVTCDWDYTVTDGTKTGTGQTGVVPPFDINFPEESTHVLTIACKDALGNEETDVEKFIVDKTPPETTKIYGTPRYPDDIYHPKWITSQTPITLTVDDTGIHKSGIKETKYRVTLLGSNDPCESDSVCQQQTGSGDWQTYTTPFIISEESCHLIEYYSVDNVDKTEIVKKQCVYVDNKPPVGSKIIGDPKIPFDDGIVFTTSGTGTAGWSNEQSHSNENSIKMTTITTSDQGRAKLPFSGNLGDITSFTYWSYVVNGGTEGQLVIWDSFYLDENGDDTWDYYVQCEPYYTYGSPTLNTWQQYDVMNMKCQNYEIPTGISLDCPHSSPTLAQYISGEAANMECPGHPEWGKFASREYGSLEVIKIDMRAGYGGPWTGFIGYIDDIKLNNDLYTGDTTWVRDHVTEITLDCTDQQPHPVDHEKMCYKISFDLDQDGYNTDQYCAQFGGQMENDWCCVDVSSENKYTFTFQEDSLHDLEYYCVDALGNQNKVDLEYFKVDSTSPVTTKTIEGPTYPASQEDIDRFGLRGDDVTNFWIRDHVTKIILDATDYAEPCDVGVKEINYRICLDKNEDNQFTEDECNSWIAVQGSHTEFTIDEDCLHKIEWYAVDMLGNTEETHVQYHRVDSTSPITIKTIEGPTWGEDDYWVTSNTQFTLTSVDYEDPCAVGVASIHVKIEWDNNCDGTINEYDTTTFEGDVQNPYTFNLNEECLHKITWYAVDYLGNEEGLNEQYHKVDNTPPHVLILKPVDGWYSEGEDIPIVAIAEDLDSRRSPCGHDCNPLGKECAVGIEDGTQCYAYLLDVLPEPRIVELETEGTFLYNEETHECQGYATITEESEIPDGVTILVVRAKDNLGNEAGSLAEILRAVFERCGCDVYDLCAPKCVDDVMQDIITIWNLPKIGIDNHAPEVTITDPVEGTLFGGEQVYFSADVIDSNDGDVTSTITTGTPCYVTIGGISLGTVPYNNENRKCSGTIMIPEDTDFSQGTQELKVEIADNAGNLGSDTVNVIVDTIAPTLDILTPANNQFVSGNVYVSFNVFDDTSYDTTKAELSLDNGQTWIPISENNPNFYQYDWDTTQETDGMAYGVIARSTDSAGNIEYSEVVIVIVDNGAPEGVYVVDPIKNDIVEGTITLKALATDYVSGVESVKIHVESDAFSCDATLTGGTWQCSFDSTQLSDGNHEAYAVAKDNLGQETTSARVPFIIDNNAPTAPVLTVIDPDGDGYDTDGTVTWSWTESTDTGSGIAYYEFMASDKPGDVITKVLGNFSTTSDLIDGTYTAKVRAVDNAGHMSDWSSGVDIIVDKTKPSTIDIWTTDVENPIYDTDGNYEIHWTGGSDDTNFDRYDIIVDGTTYGDVTSPYTGASSEGLHTYKVIAYDLAGWSTESDEVTVIVDSKDPDIEITGTVPGIGFFIATYTVNDPAPSSGIDRIIVTDTDGYALCSGTLPNGFCTVFLGSELELTAYDKAGNSDTDSTSGTEKDITPPTIIYSSPSGVIDFNDITLQVKTDEPSICHYSENDDLAGMSLMNASEGNLTHTATLGTLTDGLKVYHVLCEDLAGNKMDSSKTIVFYIDTTGNFELVIPDYGHYWSLGWNTFFLPKDMLDDICNISSYINATYPVEDILSSLDGSDPSFSMLWYFDGDEWLFYDPLYPEYSSLKEFNDEQSLPYYIKMIKEDRLTITLNNCPFSE